MFDYERKVNDNFIELSLKENFGYATMSMKKIIPQAQELKKTTPKGFSVPLTREGQIVGQVSVCYARFDPHCSF